MTYYSKTIDTPVGAVKAIASDDGLAAILWENDGPKRVRLSPVTEDPRNPVLVETARQLGEYFAGERTAFDIPLAPEGTEFQKSVWRALAQIPFGETRSYAQIAAAIGSPKAVRAVGAANGKNPVSIVTPCHRVIGSDGSLTGFAGGMAAKQLLLDHEGTHHHP
jgi:methylated-DNA-[protein]-cysteine S-methyltransferase